MMNGCRGTMLACHHCSEDIYIRARVKISCLPIKSFALTVDSKERLRRKYIFHVFYF